MLLYLQIKRETDGMETNARIERKRYNGMEPARHNGVIAKKQYTLIASRMRYETLGGLYDTQRKQGQLRSDGKGSSSKGSIVGGMQMHYIHRSLGI